VAPVKFAASAFCRVKINQADQLNRHWLANAPDFLLPSSRVRGVFFRHGKAQNYRIPASSAG
jgi:hypothetical protein